MTNTTSTEHRGRRNKVLITLGAIIVALAAVVIVLNVVNQYRAHQALEDWRGDVQDNARDMGMEVTDPVVEDSPPAVSEPGHEADVPTPGATDHNDGLPLDEMPDGGGMHGDHGEHGLTPDTPLEPGDTLALMDWDVTLGETITGDDAQALFTWHPDEDVQNDVIGEGNMMISTEITATRVTEGSGQPWEITLTWFGPDGVEVGTVVYDNPDDLDGLDTAGEVFEGGTVTALGTMTIPEDSYDGGVWAVSDQSGFRYFVAPE